MIKKGGRLENWRYTPSKVLIGEIYGDPRFKDGHTIKTSMVQFFGYNKKKAPVNATTLNTFYTLGVENTKPTSKQVTFLTYFCNLKQDYVEKITYREAIAIIDKAINNWDYDGYVNLE